MSDHLAPFALRTAFPSSLAGRYPCDYYGASVSLGATPLRRSHVRPCCTYQHDVGVPLISFNPLTGDRPRSRRLQSLHFSGPAGLGTGFNAFPADGSITSTGDWDSGSLAFTISRGPSQRTVPGTGPGRWFTGMLLSPFTFRFRVKPSGPRTSLRVPPGYTGDTARRLMAHKCKIATSSKATG
jgi:hypothetical protein